MARPGTPPAAAAANAVPAVASAVRVLRYLAVCVQGAGVSEIARGCDLSKSTAHGVVKTLEAHGLLVALDGTKRYVLGGALLELAEAVRRQRTIAQVALPCLEEVARRLRLACFLAVPYDARDFLIVEKAESAQEIKVTVSVGERFPLSAAALGKAYLAWRPASEVREILARVPLQRLTARSIKSVGAYLVELEKVRRQGFGESYEEHYVGNNALAAPVFDPSGRVVVVLLTVGFAADLPPVRMKAYGRVLRAAADRVTEMLGGRPPAQPSPRAAGLASRRPA